MTENEIATQVVDASYRIHTRLGPGLLESAYQAILAHDLRKRGLRVDSEVEVPIDWDDLRIETGFRADLIVEQKLIVELKALEKIAPVHLRQLLTYLKLTDRRLGLLINFGALLIKDGINRVVNGLQE